MHRAILGLVLTIIIGVAAVMWWGLVRREEALAEVPDGDQEVAWIHAATSISAWERFVTGVVRVSRDWPELSVDDRRAFPEETTATPELVLSVQGAEGKIRIRWYKLAQGVTAARWGERLAARSPPPLAVIGGGSSDRAVDLARALAAQSHWNGEPPLLFITTATASSIADPTLPAPVELMKVYPDRSFRMCFTNEQIAEAVVDFVWTRPKLRPQGDPVPGVYALEWDDDPYSVDLANQFHRVFHESQRGRVIVRERLVIPYSVGGQYAPNAWEAEAAERLLGGLAASPQERQLLVLPTSAAPARRVLRAICGALPLVGRNLVAVTGDSINLNNVYRDADVGWNVRALPVPLVFFSHQDPVGWDWPPPEEDSNWSLLAQSSQPDKDRASRLSPEPDKWPADALAPPTSTDETLLHRDLVRLLARSAFGADEPDAPAKLIGSADELRRRIRAIKPPVFDEVGNRASGRGEYVMSLRPKFADLGGDREILPEATLEVWTRSGEPAAWRPVKRLKLGNGYACPSNP